jgi:hypothetical protein
MGALWSREMTLRPGTLLPLIEIDLAIGIVGFALAVGWGKAVRKNLDRDTVLFLGKMFGGLMLFFLLVILLNR